MPFSDYCVPVGRKFRFIFNSNAVPRFSFNSFLSPSSYRKRPPVTFNGFPAALRILHTDKEDVWETKNVTSRNYSLQM